MPGAEMNLTLCHIWYLEREEKVLPFIQFSTVYVSHKTASGSQESDTVWNLGSKVAGFLVFSRSALCPRSVQASRATQLGLSRSRDPGLAGSASLGLSHEDWRLSRDALKPVLCLVTRPIHEDYLKREIVPAFLKTEVKGLLS